MSRVLQHDGCVNAEAAIIVPDDSAAPSGAASSLERGGSANVAPVPCLRYYWRQVDGLARFLHACWPHGPASRFVVSRPLVGFGDVL